MQNDLDELWAMCDVACPGARYVVVILYVARYVVSVRADTWLGAAAMPAS